MFTTCNDESSRLEKDKKKIQDNIIQDEKNLFRLKKEIHDNAIKNLRNLFRLKKKMNQSKKE